MSRQSLHQRNFLLSRQEEERSVDGRTGVLRFGLLVLFLHAHQRHGDLLKQTLHVMTGFCRSFHKHDIELRRLRVRLLERDLPVCARQLLE